MQVVSSDGVTIAVEQSGAGAPLVLVHGVAADHTFWAQVVPLLAQNYTVYTVDRRGRGGSGDRASYSLAREVDDIAAVCAAIGAPVTLLGNGFGGLIALEVALRNVALANLIIYEPWIIQSRVLKPGLLARLEALPEQERREALLTSFYLDIMRLPAADLDTLRASAAWQTGLDVAATILRELKALEGYFFDGMRFRQLVTPTLLLYGENSIPSAGRQVWIAHEAILTSKVGVIAGQTFNAMNTAPEAFAAAVGDFIEGGMDK